MEDMEKVEHQGENENHELTTTENFSNSWGFNKKLPWIQFEKKMQHCLPIYTYFWSNCDEWFIGSHLM
jgi:hypothetical protein